jgi:hypothetical protein
MHVSRAQTMEIRIMQRSLLLAAAAAATLFTATAANASHVNWSVGINLPVASVVSSGPAYYPAPAYYGAPAYAPEPVYYPAPSFYPAPVVYAPRFYAPRPRVWVPAPHYGVPGRGPGPWHHDGRVDWRR